MINLIIHIIYRQCLLPMYMCRYVIYIYRMQDRITCRSFAFPCYVSTFEYYIYKSILVDYHVSAVYPLTPLYLHQTTVTISLISYYIYFIDVPDIYTQCRHSNPTFSLCYYR